MYFDEAAFARTEVFFDVALPILERRDAVLIMISTVLDETNYFSRLLTLKHPDTGRLVFNVYRQVMVCERCLEKGRMGLCKHMQRFYPSWKSKKQHDINKLVYQNTAQMERESLGVLTESTSGCFVREDIKALHERRPFDWHADMEHERRLGNAQSYPKFVFVTCDPNANGANHCAMMAGVYLNGRFIICGMAGKPLQGVNQIIDFTHDFLTQVRQHPLLSRSWIILAQESNSNLTPGLQETFVTNQMDRVEVLRDYANGLPGVYTDHKRKNLYYKAAMRVLQMRQAWILRDLVVSRPPFGENDPQQQREIVVEEFIQQLKRCKVREAAILDDRQVQHLSWSGKIGADGKVQRGQNDDLAMAFTMLCFWSSQFMMRQIRDMDYEKFGGL